MKLAVTMSVMLAGIAGLTLTTGGCASTEIPLAKNPPLYAQEKVQAVDHWDNIANEVAMRVQKSLEDRPDLVAIPIYVKPPNDRPFSMAFHDLLRTRLVSRGMQVADVPEAATLMLEYNVQTVLHDSSRGSWLPSLAAMGIGIVHLATGQYTTTSDHEIIINSSIIHHNRYVMHLSHVAYINEADWPLYVSPESSDPMARRTRTVHITGR